MRAGPSPTRSEASPPLIKDQQSELPGDGDELFAALNEDVDTFPLDRRATTQRKRMRTNANFSLEDAMLEAEERSPGEAIENGAGDDGEKEIREQVVEEAEEAEKSGEQQKMSGAAATLVQEVKEEDSIFEEDKSSRSNTVGDAEDSFKLRGGGTSTPSHALMKSHTSGFSFKSTGGSGKLRRLEANLDDGLDLQLAGDVEYVESSVGPLDFSKLTPHLRPVPQDGRKIRPHLPRPALSLEGQDFLFHRRAHVTAVGLI